MKSVRTKLIASILICSLFTSVLIGVIAISNSVRTAGKDAMTMMQLTGQKKTEEINSTIQKIEQSVDTLSEVAMSNFDYDSFRQSKDYADTYTETVQQAVLDFANHTNGAVTVYLRYNPNYSNPTSGVFAQRQSVDSELQCLTPTDFSMYDESDVEHVGWYYVPVENGAPLWMDPYLNGNVNIYMISYVVPLYVDGESVGIIGMDIDFSQITGMVEKTKAFSTGYSFLYKPDGSIMYHPEMENGADLEQLGMTADEKARMCDAANEGQGEGFSSNGTKNSAVFYTLDNGMMVALSAPDSEITSDAVSLSTMMIGTCVVCLLICVVLAVILSRSIAAPITGITRVIRQTADLDFQKTKSGESLVKRKDETGVMAGAVSDMRKVFRELIGDITAAETTILTDMDKLDSIMQANSEMAEDNSATTQEMAAGMQETTASASMITGNIDGIKQNTEDIKELSKEGQETSVQVKGRADQLQSTTISSSNKALAIFEEMKIKTQEAIEKSKAVDQINNLTENIKQISSQTNLLALNANIEAARAGEAGKGFAVVATEIGNLSNQTYATVDGITEMVTEVNSAVNSMTDCMTTIMDFLENTVVLDYNSFREIGKEYQADANTFADAMGRIYSEITKLDEQISDIAENVTNVSETISQSAQGVSQIAEKSSDAAAKTTEGYELLRESRDSIAKLRTIIERFRL